MCTPIALIIAPLLAFKGLGLLILLYHIFFMLMLLWFMLWLLTVICYLIILDLFFSIFRLKVNRQNSVICFSNRVTNGDELASLLNISNQVHKLIYLGLPIFIEKLQSSDFIPLIQKIFTSLDGWNTKLFIICW